MSQPSRSVAVSRSSADTGFDAFLGSGSRRYLADGYRRVRYQVERPLVGGPFPNTFSTSAEVRYPNDWSQKGEAERAPHLSTLDAIRLASLSTVELADTHLPWLRAFTAEEHLTVRAGVRPWEDLQAVPVTTKVTRQDEDFVVVETKAGSLFVVSQRRRGLLSTQVCADSRKGRVAAVELLGDDAATCVYSSPGALLRPIDFGEVLTLTAQLAQVILYQGDAANRDKSGNMWMRRASFERQASPLTTSRAVNLSLHSRRRLQVGGKAIETAEVLAEDVFGVRVTASLAMGS